MPCITAWGTCHGAECKNAEHKEKKDQGIDDNDSDENVDDGIYCDVIIYVHCYCYGILKYYP